MNLKPMLNALKSHRFLSLLFSMTPLDNLLPAGNTLPKQNTPHGPHPDVLMRRNQHFGSIGPISRGDFMLFVVSKPSLRKELLAELICGVDVKHVPTVIFSQEKAPELFERLVAHKSHMGMRQLRAAKKMEPHLLSMVWPELRKTLDYLKQSQIWIDDSREHNPHTLVCQTARFAEQSRIGLLVVDCDIFMQGLHPSDIIPVLRQFGKERNVAVACVMRS